jgi:hypothetical protein
MMVERPRGLEGLADRGPATGGGVCVDKTTAALPDTFPRVAGDRETATLDLIDVAGRRVLRREVGSLGPGPHSVTLEAAPPIRPGLYFLRLARGPRVLTDRVAVIR